MAVPGRAAEIPRAQIFARPVSGKRYRRAAGFQLSKLVGRIVEARLQSEGAPVEIQRAWHIISHEDHRGAELQRGRFLAHVVQEDREFGPHQLDSALKEGRLRNFAGLRQFAVLRQVKAVRSVLTR